MKILYFILGFIKGIASGGGGGATVDPVHTVIFMSEDGTEVLYQRSVVDGDDCADVVARGLLAKPTKESTPQYSYTYSGWSMTSGGAASSSALSAVTEDRTVYAAFTTAVRYYTITYYDGDTVLKSESLAYGAMPSYTPVKDGYSFDGWEPALAEVTGDAYYTARWLEAITFAGSTWEDISRVCEAGEADKYFTIGDTREIQYGDSTGNVYTGTFMIIGINHDDKADGTGKAGISVFLTTPEISEMLNDEKPTYDGVSGWYAGGWLMSDVRATLNGKVFESFPSELQNVIKSVTKISNAYKDGTTSRQVTSTDKIWMLSAGEAGMVNSTGYKVEPEGGTAYAFKPQSIIYEYIYEKYQQQYVYLRTGAYGSSQAVSYYRKTLGSAPGAFNFMGASNLTRIAFGFCI